MRAQRALTYGSAGELLLVFLLTITIAAVMLTQVRRPSAVVEWFLAGVGADYLLIPCGVSTDHAG